MKRSAFVLIAMAVLAGCSSEDTAESASSTATSTNSASTDPSCAPFDAYQGSSGTVVTFLVHESMLSGDAPLDTTWAEFTRCTGIRITLQIDRTGSMADLNARLDSGNAPDLLAVAQPGMIAELAHQDGAPNRPKLVPAAAAVAANVDEYWNPAWRQYASVDGVLYASPQGSNVKSLVWYSPRKFTESGYAVPETWEELMSLSDRIRERDDGTRPWCAGIEDGAATGWPATDWLEEVVLGTYGGETYDAWVSHELPFDSPEIQRSMETLDEWMRNPDYVNGGWGDVASIARTAFLEAGRPLLDGTCWMFPYPSFYVGYWGSTKPGTTIGPDEDIFAFVLPSVDPKVPVSLVGGGEFIVSYSDRPEVQKAHAYLSSPDWATRHAQLDGWVSANSGVPLDTYTVPISRLSAELLTEPAATFRFDASDLLPAKVAEEEWRQLTAWFADGKPSDEVLQAIDASWSDVPAASPSP